MKTYSVLFSAPWHDDNAGYHWTGKAGDPRDAVLRAVASDLPYGNIDRPEETNGDADKVTIVWLCEGELPAYIDVLDGVALPEGRPQT